MYGATESHFARLRSTLENEWVPQMMKLLAIHEKNLPALWDADFLFGPKTADGDDTYVSV